MTRQISVALIRQGDTILLVHQKGIHDAYSYWALPGGVVESGETLPEALIREVREETGLQVTELGSLIYLAQTVNDTSRSTAFVFEVIHWTGKVQVDSDPLVFEAAFFPLKEAVDHLEHIPYRNMREPILAYLRGAVSIGASWFYRIQQDGSTLVDCLALNRTSKG